MQHARAAPVLTQLQRLHSGGCTASLPHSPATARFVSVTCSRLQAAAIATAAAQLLST
jgi:hypothetical protein